MYKKFLAHGWATIYFIIIDIALIIAIILTFLLNDNANKYIVVFILLLFFCLLSFFILYGFQFVKIGKDGIEISSLFFKKNQNRNKKFSLPEIQEIEVISIFFFKMIYITNCIIPTDYKMQISANDKKVIRIMFSRKKLQIIKQYVDLQKIKY